LKPKSCGFAVSWQENKARGLPRIRRSKVADEAEKPSRMMPVLERSVVEPRVRDFARSKLFARTFTEGMGMVEEAANYLDGPGRAATSGLTRFAALAYAGESMRLTTRLMQMASWLLVQRAVRDGDMTIDDALDPKYRLAEAADDTPLLDVSEDIPEGLTELLRRSSDLYTRLRHLDARVYLGIGDAPEENPVGAQLSKLRAVFEA
jgi:regulator of CtrA degradation